MLISALAANFWVMAVSLSAAFYADFALTVLGQKLYLEHGREHQVHAAYELNPKWREIISRARYWHPKLLVVVGIIALLAGCIWYLHEQPLGEVRLIPASYLQALAEAAFCIALSRWLVVIGMHLRNIYVYSRLMRPELVSGRITVSAEFTYGSSIAVYLCMALPAVVLAILAPSSATVGFALGPLLLVSSVGRMQEIHMAVGCRVVA